MLSSALPLIFNSYPSPDFKVTVDKLVFRVLLYLATWHPTQTAPTCLACHKSLLSHRFPKWARQPQRRRNRHQIFRLPAVTRSNHVHDAHAFCRVRRGASNFLLDEDSRCPSIVDANVLILFLLSCFFQSFQCKCKFNTTMSTKWMYMTGLDQGDGTWAGLLFHFS